MIMNLTGDDVIRTLELKPHPEGGYYREIYQDAPVDGSRGLTSSIYFLLRAGDRSHWHRFDAVETWCYHAGSPLEVAIWTAGRSVEKYRLGMDLSAGERPQLTVPAGSWQEEQTLGDWSLVGCVTTPAFQFAGFELAPADWRPPNTS